MQSNKEQKKNTQHCLIGAELELLSALESLHASLDVLVGVTKRVQDKIRDDVTTSCWDCGELNLMGREVCIHCGQLLDEADRNETLAQMYEEDMHGQTK